MFPTINLGFLFTVNPEGGGGNQQNSVSHGEALPRGGPLSFLYAIFNTKGPLRIPSTGTWSPFHKPTNSKFVNQKVRRLEMFELKVVLNI